MKSSSPLKSEIKLSNNGVLFDEDYRLHIERLQAKLERERREVIKLRTLLYESRLGEEKD